MDVASLRGAAVAADPLRVRRTLVVLAGVTLAASAAGLTVAGARAELRQHALQTRGVAVTVRVSGCSGQPGGSGSNVATYACTGTFRLDGRSHRATVPGGSFLAVGSAWRGVTLPDDPAVLAAPAAVSQAPLPAVLLAGPALLGAAAAGAAMGWRRVSSGGS
ncbi:MAG TPA: hypothetical protein VFN60_07470 [Acidimicrobiales bacterium]|nr:hypothetical protein [Acidimicrobiales bacterium]